MEIVPPPVSPIYKKRVKAKANKEPCEGSSDDDGGSFESSTDEEGVKKGDTVETNVDEEKDMMAPTGDVVGVEGDGDVAAGGVLVAAAVVGNDSPAADVAENLMNEEPVDAIEGAEDDKSVEPPEEVVTVADIYERDEAIEGGGGAAIAADQPAVEHVMGLPVGEGGCARIGYNQST